MEFYIETERLLLREVQTADAPAMYAMESRPEVHRYLGNNHATSITQVEDNIAYIQQQYAEHGIGRWAVIEKDSGAWVGWSGLKHITTIENGRTGFYDVGYRLHPAYWGRGYATESAKAALHYGFTVLQLEEIIGMVNKHNAASRRALQKCGLLYVEDFYWRELLCEWMRIGRDQWSIAQNKS